MKNLIKRVQIDHPELSQYYERSNLDEIPLTVRGLVNAYELDRQYHISKRTAILALYNAIKDQFKKQAALERLEEEYKKEFGPFAAPVQEDMHSR